MIKTVLYLYLCYELYYLDLSCIMYGIIVGEYACHYITVCLRIVAQSIVNSTSFVQIVEKYKKKILQNKDKVLPVPALPHNVMF